MVIFKEGMQIYKTEESKLYNLKINKKGEYWDMACYGNFLIYYVRFDGIYLIDITKENFTPSFITKHVGGPIFSRTIKISQNEDCVLLTRAKSAVRIIDINEDGTPGTIDFELEESKGVIRDFFEFNIFLKLKNNTVIREPQIGIIRDTGKMSAYSYNLKEQNGKVITTTMIPLLVERSETPYTLLVCKKGNLFIVHTVTNIWSASKIIVYRYDGLSQFEYMNEVDLFEEGLAYFHIMKEIGYHDDGSYTFMSVTFDTIQPVVLTFNYHMGMNSVEEVTRLRKFFYGNSPYKMIRLGEEFVTSDKDGKIVKISYS